MEQFEQLVRDLEAKGFLVKSYYSGNGKWHVELTCSIDVMPAQYPRPIGRGETQMAALEDAIVNGRQDAERYKIKNRL